MSRRRITDKRVILPDSKYGNILVAKLINLIMFSGLKTKAEAAVYFAIWAASKELKEDPLEVFLAAVDNVKPSMEVRSRRIGGATYQVPVEVRYDRSNSLALKWIRDAARSRRGLSMKDRLKVALVESYKGVGSAVKKRDDNYKLAEVNKAFAHFRW